MHEAGPPPPPGSEACKREVADRDSDGEHEQGHHGGERVGGGESGLGEERGWAEVGLWRWGRLLMMILAERRDDGGGVQTSDF